MRTVLLLSVLALAGCSRHTGSIIGKVVDVSYGGLMFDSCEIVIQKGEGSSSMDRSSSTDKRFCDLATKLQGQVVTIEYVSGGLAIRTETNDIITSLEKK